MAKELSEISEKDLEQKLMIFFANFIAEPVEVEEGEEKKEQPKDFKPLVDLHNTTKLEGKA